MKRLERAFAVLRRRWLYLTIGGSLGGYLLLVAGVYVFQERLIFFPTGVWEVSRLGLAGQEIELDSADPEIKLRGWLLPSREPAKTPLLIYFSGNAGESSWGMLLHQDKLLPLGGTADMSLLFINYRGYGDSDGEPSQEALTADALAIYDQARERLGVPPNKIFSVGRSLGSHVAAHLAAHRPVGGLVLVTPFDSVREVAADVYPYILGVRLLVRHPFDTVALSPQIDAPTLFLVAGKDTYVKRGRTDTLIQSWQAPYAVTEMPEASHYDVYYHDQYWQDLFGFIRQHAAAAANRGGQGAAQGRTDSN